MKVNRVYANRILKRGLEFAADNGALFAAGTSLALSLGIRPLSILVTPKTNKDNKKAACSKSVVSSLLGYGVTLIAARPLSRAVKKINAKPEVYLKKETINTFKSGMEKLTDSKSYQFATQLFKLGLGAVIAAPKSVLTALGVPVVMKKLDNKKEVTFTGKNERLAKDISKILDKKGLQNFAEKYKDTNFPMHIAALTDTVATATFVSRIKSNNKMSNDRKNPLIFNSIISTALSILSGYTVDKLLDKPVEKFIEKFKKINIDDPKLNKYIEGIRIAKPVIILGGIYYTVIPIISTFLADRIGKDYNEVK